jgi:hypothetical protein
MTTQTTYYSILTFGPIIEGRKRSYYRSEEAARRDAQALVGPSTIRIGRYATRKAAIHADISDS